MPVSSSLLPRAVRTPRWLGAVLLVVGIMYLLALGPLREGFSAIPDPAWFVALMALLGAGGAMMARGLAGGVAHREWITRHRRLGRAAVLLGVTGLSTGVVSVSAHADGWSDGERSAGALAFCVALALLPFGITLLRQLTRGPWSAVGAEGPTTGGESSAGTPGPP